MNRTPAIPLLTIAALALAGCGGGDSDDTSQEAEDQNEQQEEVGDFEDAEDGADEEEEHNGRMTEEVTAEVGDPVEVDLGPFEEGNPYAGIVTLAGVEFSDTCVYDARDGSTAESESGSFVHLTFEIEADEEAEDSLDVSNANTFRWDDYHYALSTPESLDCELDLGHQDPIEPGETGEYTAVWDVPSTEAELQWTEPTYTVTWLIDGDEGEVDRSEGSEDDDAEASGEEAAQEAPAEDLPESDDHYDDHAEREGATLDDGDEWNEDEWEDPGYVSRAEEEEAMMEGECPVGTRNLSTTGLDCQPLDVSAEEYVEENDIPLDAGVDCDALVAEVDRLDAAWWATEPGSVEESTIGAELDTAVANAESAGCFG